MKIALVIPVSRAWRWQTILIDSLRKNHTVDVFYAPGSRYPALLQIFLHIESFLYGKDVKARPVRIVNICDKLQKADPSVLHEYECIINIASIEIELEHQNVLTLSYDGERDDLYLFGRLLNYQSPIIAVEHGPAHEPIAFSYPAIEDKEVLVRALSFIFARATAMLVRAVGKLEGSSGAGPTIDALPERPAVRYTNAQVWRFAVRNFLAKVGGKFEKLFFREKHWTLAIRRTNPIEAEPLPRPEGFSPITLPSDAYYADPFLHVRDGHTFLFAEKFPYSSMRGIIVCATLDEEGQPGAFETVLERPYHLSYPFVFEHEGTTYMIPETLQSEAVELYRAIKFPEQWALETILLDNLAISDATLLNWNGLWYLFGSVSTFGGSTQDELHAFYSPTIFGPWTPHALNPLKLDVRSARPAGRFTKRDDRLFRPAQDCEEGYGAALAWCEVVSLSPTEFEERIVARWRGCDLGEFTGIHTYNSAGGFEVVDLKCTVRR